MYGQLSEDHGAVSVRPVAGSRISWFRTKCPPHQGDPHRLMLLFVSSHSFFGPALSRR